MRDLTTRPDALPRRRETAAAQGELTEMVRRVRRRRAWTTWSDRTLDLLFYGYFALACLFLVDRIRAGAVQTASLSTPLAVVAALLGVTAGAAAWGALRAWWRGPRDVEVAILTDRRFGLEDRFSTALDLIRQLESGAITGRSAELARAQVEDAARFVRVQDARQVFPSRPLGDRWTSAIAFLIALWIALLPPEDFHRADLRRPSLVPEASGAAATREGRIGARAGEGKGGGGTPDARGTPQPGGGGGKSQNPSPGSGGQGESEPESQPNEGNGPGSGGGGSSSPPSGPQESPEQLFGEPERLDVRTRPKEVDPIQGEGPTRTEERSVYGGDPDASGRSGPPVPVDFQTLLAEYRRVAEQTLRREHIPPADRDFVRRYFEAIGPKD